MTYFLNGTERGKQSLDASLRQLELCLPPKGVEEEGGCHAPNPPVYTNWTDVVSQLVDKNILTPEEF